jgi:hypothetical protein
MKIDEQGNVWVRQSWLDTAMRCPERGRLASTLPEWDEITSDSALIGTGAHYGIEQVIRGRDASKIEQIAYDYVIEYAEPVKWTKYSTLTECADHAARCAAAWREHIMPVAPLENARAEVTFHVPLYEHRTGRTVGIEGTIDLVPTDGTLWDWKTAARAYRQRDKQRFAVQPTIYALAAVMGGLQSAVTYSWPMTFTYGVMVRGSKESTAQILTVQRTEAHADWVRRRIETYVDLALGHGLDKSWPMVDENNYLCSQTWCPWYTICRGAHLSPAEDNFDGVTETEAILRFPTAASAA